MKKYFFLTLVFVLFSFVVQAKPMLNGLTADEFANRQTDILKDKIQLPQDIINKISNINLIYANKIYTLCDSDKSYAEIKMSFYDLIDNKKIEISNLLPEDSKSVYSDLEDKFKQMTWNEIKIYIKKRGVK
jgi:hypothetical protein